MKEQNPGLALLGLVIRLATMTARGSSFEFWRESVDFKGSYNVLTSRRLGSMTTRE